MERINKGRFSIPADLSCDKIVLFDFVDVSNLAYRRVSTLTDHLVRADGFGIKWEEADREFLQLFGYRVASVDEMNAKVNDGGGGFDYFCFKINPTSQGEEILSLPSPDQISREHSSAEIIGFGRANRIMHYPSACREAMYMTYKEARFFGEEVSERVGLELFEQILGDIKWDLCQNGSWCSKKVLVSYLEKAKDPRFYRKK